MRFSSPAAAFGIFQLVYAEMTYKLAFALFRLRRLKEPKQTFIEVFRIPFGQMLREFKKELRQFDGSADVADELAAVRKTCCQMREIAKWRNECIHVMVRLEDDGYALYEWKTGQRLQMNLTECERRIQDAQKVIITLPDDVNHLVISAESDKWLDGELDKVLQDWPDED